MNDDRQFERNARTWLEIGPTDAPGRVVENALLTIETTPQDRDLRVPWRLPRMTTSIRFATAAVIGVLAVGGFLLFRNVSPQIGRPSPSPTVVASPSMTAAELSGVLQSKWTSVGPRSQPPGTDPFGATMVIGPTGVRIWAFKADIMSAWSVADGQLTVRLVASQGVLNLGHWDCRTGQEGTYSASVPGKGETLTLVAVADACATRAAILAGAWTRSRCDASDDRCNELAAGRHQSTVALPGDLPASPAIASYSYAVPTGWTSELLGDGTLFRLADGMGINLRFDLAPRSHAAGCPEIAAPGKGTSAAAIAAWLRTVPGITTTTPTAVMIGGYAGVMLDLSDDTSSTDPCRSPGIAPQIFVFMHPGLPSLLPSFSGPAYRSRYVILDLPGGHNLLIDITMPDQATFAGFLSSAMPIIDSLQFTVAGP
jgi:hypothetical protein